MSYEELSEGEQRELRELVGRYFAGQVRGTGLILMPSWPAHTTSGHGGSFHASVTELLYGSTPCQPDPIADVVCCCLALRCCLRNATRPQAVLEELPTDSLKRIRETYRAMKAVATAGSGALGGSPAAQLQQAEARGGAGPGAEEAGLVGDPDPGSQMGFILGSAPLGARPPGSPTAAAAAGWAAGRGTNRRPASGRVGGALGDAPLLLGTAGVAAEAAAAEGAQRLTCGAAEGLPASQLDLNALFLKWKSASGEGRRLAAAVRERGRALAELKSAVKVGEGGLYGTPPGSLSAHSHLWGACRRQALSSPTMASSVEMQAHDLRCRSYPCRMQPHASTPPKPESTRLPLPAWCLAVAPAWSQRPSRS